MRQYDADQAVFLNTNGMFYSTWGFIVPPKQPVFTTSFVTSTYCFENVIIYRELFELFHSKTNSTGSIW